MKNKMKGLVVFALLLGLLLPSSFALDNSINHTLTNTRFTRNFGNASYTNRNSKYDYLYANYSYENLKVDILNIENYPPGQGMDDYWKVTYKAGGIIRLNSYRVDSNSVTARIQIGGSTVAYQEYIRGEDRESLYVRYDDTKINTSSMRKNDSMKVDVKLYISSRASFKYKGDWYSARAEVDRLTTFNINSPPSLSMDTSKQYMNEEDDKNSVTFSGKVWDEEGDALTIKLINGSKEKMISMPNPPTEEPPADNFTFTMTQADFNYVDVSGYIRLAVEDTHEDINQRGLSVVYDRLHPKGKLNTLAIKGGETLSVESSEKGQLILTKKDNYNQIEDVDRINSIFYPIKEGLSSTVTSDTLSGVYSAYLVDETGNMSDRIGIVEIDSKAPKVISCYIDGNTIKLIYDEKLDQVIASDDILIKAKELYSNFVQYLIGEQELQYDMIFDDFDGDPKILDAFVFSDFDNSMFDNKNGTPDFINKELRTPKLELPNVGKYKLLAYQIDDPSTDPNFDSFQKKSNEINVELLAHRRPIMELLVTAKKTSSKYEISLNYFGYDFDHEFSRPDKGIVEVECEYRLSNASTWTKGFPPSELPVVEGQDWVIRIKGKDPEGVWSKYAVDYIKESQETLELDVELDPVYPGALPITENLNITCKVITASNISSVTAVLNGQTINIPFSKNGNGFEKVYETSYKLPDTTQDKNYYELPVTATLSSGTSEMINKKVNVFTPINLQGILPEELRGNYEQVIAAETSKYADVVYVNLFKGESFEESLNLTEVDQEDGKKKWEVLYNTSESIPEAEYIAEFIAMLPTGKVEKQIVPFKVKHLALYDFKITRITDKDFDYLSNKIYSVSDMAIDKFDHKDKKLMKLGYGFYFEIKSKGLKDIDDYIRIRPKFYNSVTGEELDLFYHLKNKSYIKATTDDGMRAVEDTYKMYYSKYRKPGEQLGFINRIEIHSALRESKTDYHLWKGRYGVPGNSIFTLKGEDEPWKVSNQVTDPVMITFDIEAIRDGKASFNYVDNDQWEKERRYPNTLIINPVKYSKYDPGEVILIDPTKSIDSDFRAIPIW